MTDGTDVIPSWYIGYGWLSGPKSLSREVASYEASVEMYMS